MNCKPGDLAMYRGKDSSRLGMVTQVLRLASHEEVCRRNASPVPGPWWEVDPPLRDRKLVADSALRPIRPTDGEDEILRIAGKPETSHA